MKKYLVKAILIIVLLSGVLLGLLSYSQVLSFWMNLTGFKLNWILVILIWTISLFVARKGSKSLNQDLLMIKEVNEITPIKILGFFLGGFIGVYIGIIIIGTVIFGSYIVFRSFLLR